MLWLLLLALVLAACVAAYLLDRHDRRQGHVPGSGRGTDAGYLDQRSFPPQGIDPGGGAGGGGG